MAGTPSNDPRSSDQHSFSQNAAYSGGDAINQQRQQSAISVVSETAGLLQNSKHLDRLYGKSSRVLVPIFVLCIIWNHIDRTNLAFAALTMNRDLGFDAVTYGLGSALFFPTFCLFQVPSNLIMVRVGVRRWLSFLLFAWGCIASCFALVHDRTSFFVLRLLLGMFESGAAPAMWFHLSQFYPQERLVKPYSFMSMGILLANVLGAPLAAGLLAMDGIAGLHGWQWLFLLEGIPSILLSAAVLIWVPEHLDSARWFTDTEKGIVKHDMAKAAEHSPPRELIPRNPFRLLGHAISNPLIAYMCVVGFMLSTAAYTFIFFLPMMVQALVSGRALGAAPPGNKGGNAALLTSIPYTAGAITTWIVAHSSQKRQELYWHCSLSLMFAGIFFSVFPVMSAASVAAGFASLVMTVAGAAAANGPGVTIVADISKGPSQVVGMPLYNSISAVGGFVGPYMAGAIVQQTGNFKMIAVIMGVLLFACGVLVIVLKPVAAFRGRRLERLASCRTDPEQPADSRSNCAPASVQLPSVVDSSSKDVARVERESSTCVLVGGKVDSAGASAAVGRRAAAAPPPPLH